MVTAGALVVWFIAAVLAAAVFFSRFEARRTREKFMRQLLSVDPKRREQILSRLSPKLQSELRGELSARGRYE